MARIRAYKIAEELGLEKEELLKRAAEAGIELRSAMVSLDDDQVDLLRRKLGGRVEDTRIEKRVGSTVILRRRKRAADTAAPAPEPAAAAPAEESGLAAPAEELAPEAEELEAGLPEPEPLAAEGAPGAVPPPSSLAGGEGATDSAALPRVQRGVKIVEEAPAPAPASDAAARPGVAAPAQKRGGVSRRSAIEDRTIKEQETIARMMRGNVQHQLEKRRLTVEQQSRHQTRLHRARSGPRPLRAAPGKRESVVRLGESITLADMAAQTGVKVRELARRGRNLGFELDRDSFLDAETAQLLAADLGVEVQQVSRDFEEAVRREAAEEKDLAPRWPVVTVMGHVDHGKTSLLDSIRQTHVAAGEAGGITQHIGAYTVRAGGGQVTFIDTPGHAAFTQMRARGARTTDIVVLVVAADDGVMPQTVEAIDHARAAGVPIMVAINKVDKPEARPDRVKQALLEHGLVSEDFGGDVICVEVSATKGTGIEKLLEMLALQAEVLELRTRQDGPARGVVLEARVDKGRGAVATVLVQEGTLRPGDAVVMGQTFGRVRAMLDDQGKTLKSAGPSQPVEIVGLTGIPEAGDEMLVAPSEREARAIVEHRVAEDRRAATGDAALPEVSEDLFAALSEGDERELALVLKADVRGTMEAIREAMEKLSSERVKLRVIHAAVGGITESDVTLAEASGARVVGFHVRPDSAARRAAEGAGVEIRTFDIVYELLDDVVAQMEGLLPPKLTEKVLATLEVRALFPIPRVGTVAGCMVSEGAIRRANPVRVLRSGVPVYTGRLASLRRFKDDVREVTSGLECGLSIENYSDVKVGDTIESFVVEETRDTL